MTMFRAGNAFSKKQQAPTAAPAPAPAASRRPLGGSKLPSMSRSAAPAVAPTTTRGVPTDNYGNLYIGTRRRQSTPVAPNSTAQANQGQQAAMQRFNATNMANISKASTAPLTPQQDIASLQAAKVAAAQRQQAVPRTLAPTGASMGVPGMDFRMAKGGMTKKTGYAKGGAVMCGASMPPAQKRKK